MVANRPRDSRLDVWRGLCLIDVILVHLAYNGLGFPQPLDDLVKHYTRFAAGGFVFLAGLTVGVAFGPAAERGGAAACGIYRRLWQRAALLVVIDVLAAVALRLLDGARAFPSDAHTPLGEAIYTIASLQRPGITGGIFLLYALLLAGMPAVFELRRVAGTWAIVTLSAAGYVAAVASHGLLIWPPYDFPLLYWQPLFVAGFVSLPVYEWLRHGSRLRSVAWAALASCAFAVVFGLQFGLSGRDGAPVLDFAKRPLQPGALLWYFAAVNVVLAWSHVFWNQIVRSQLSSGLALLGRHSLLIYTAHVFTEIPVLEYVWGAWPPAVVRIACGVADVLALLGVAVVAERRMPQRVLAALRGTAPASPTRWATAATALACTGAALVLLLSTPHVEQSLDISPAGFLESAVVAEDGAIGTGDAIEPAILFECDGASCTEQRRRDDEGDETEEPIASPESAGIDAEPI